MECFSKIQTFLLFNLLGLRPVLSTLETFKAFLAGFPTVFLALPPTTTFQPFSRPQWTGHSTVFQAWLFNALLRYAFWFFNCPLLHNLHQSTSWSVQCEARNHPHKQFSVWVGARFCLVVDFVPFVFTFVACNRQKWGSLTDIVRGVSLLPSCFSLLFALLLLLLCVLAFMHHASYSSSNFEKII